jgi:hypothetical protein
MTDERRRDLSGCFGFFDQAEPSGDVSSVVACRRRVAHTASATRETAIYAPSTPSARSMLATAAGMTPV